MKHPPCGARGVPLSVGVLGKLKDLRSGYRRGRVPQLRRTALALSVLTLACCGGKEAGSESGQETASVERELESGRLELDVQTQQQLGIECEPVEMRKLRRKIRLSGVVAPDVGRVAEIRPLTRGRLRSVNVTIGDRVKKDQILALYDDIELGDLAAQWAAAQAALERAASEASVDRQAAERARRLVEIGALAPAEKERREAAYQQNLSRIEESRIAVDQIRQKIRRLGVDPDQVERRSEEDQPSAADSPLLSPLAAPFGGVLIESGAAVGGVIDADTVLFKLADISRVWVLGNLHEKDIGLVEPGQKAAVEIAGRRFEARISYVSDFLEPVSRTAQVRCEVQNPRFELKLGMFATVQTVLTEEQPVPAVPLSAIQRMDGEQVVFVRQSSSLFEKRGLQLGRRGDHWIEVLNGLSPGETIVAEGSFRLKAAFLRGSLVEED